MLKESDNPPITWPENERLESFAGQWWVVHTKSRNEKSLAQDLIVRDVCYFLPMRWQKRHVRGRKIKSLLPLFSGYLFVCGEEAERLKVLQTNRAANIIPVKDQQCLIEELTCIERALLAGVDLQPHKYVKAGSRCRVTSGPLKDIEGIVDKTGSGTRLILKVDMLGQAASVEVDMDIIEILE